MSDDTLTYFIKRAKELEQEAHKQRTNRIRNIKRHFSKKYWKREKEERMAEYPVAHDRFAHHPIRVTDERNVNHIYPSPDAAAKALGLEYHDIVMICHGKGSNTVQLPWPINRKVTIREEIQSYHELITEASRVLDENEPNYVDGIVPVAEKNKRQQQQQSKAWTVD